MNQQERDALRRKHYFYSSRGYDQDCICGSSWPCDVIKVLDAWEAER